MTSQVEGWVCDEVATRAAVEKYLLQAREYRVTAYIPEEAIITASYRQVAGGASGGKSDQTAAIAQRNTDEPERRARHVARAEQAISKLGERQQRLIRLRYLEEDHVLDLEVALELGYSDRHYRRIKALALARLAAMLGLVQVKAGEEVRGEMPLHNDKDTLIVI